jgi:uncharacterized protein (TIRG00374 family)
LKLADTKGALTAKRSAFSQPLFLAVTLAISIACLIWTLQGAELSRIGAEIRALEWHWVAIAVVADVLVYVWHGWRWSLLLSPIAEIPFFRTVRAIYVGLFANEVLPFRTGELIRCYLLGKWSHLPFSVVLSSAIIERIFDGFWLLVGLFVSFRLAPLPAQYATAGLFVGVVVALAALLVGAAMFYKQETHSAFSNHRWLKKLNILLEDLHIIGHSRFLYFSAFASVPYLLMQIVPIYALAQSYGINISWRESFVLTVILRLGSVIPQAPGNLGTFQALTAAGLLLFGVEQSLAKRFAFVLWGVITLPLLIVGFIALAITGMKLTELREEAEAKLEQAPGR